MILWIFGISLYRRADSENISLQALGVYAWNLALTAYGLEPIADSGE